MSTPTGMAGEPWAMPACGLVWGGLECGPDRLPDEFKVDGLRVVFSGRVKPVEPNVRSWGIPFELTAIKRE
mgnify:CR=1 FL=1